MQIFNSGLFWFLEGFLFMVVILAVRAWARDQGHPMPLWKWALFVLWVFLAGFTIAFVGTSFGEGEVVAATRGGLLSGLITLIAGVWLWRLLVARKGVKSEDPVQAV